MPDIRRLAIHALEDILSRHKLPKETLETLRTGIEKRDRAFLMELVYGVVRHRDTLDWILGNFLMKPSKLSPYTINNLRVGVYQIFHMRVPEWALVNEAVRLERGKPELINAVLRNAAREHEKLSLSLKQMAEASLMPETPEAMKLSYISTLTSHPKWLIKRWIKRFGYKDALRLAEMNNTIAPLTLRVNRLKIQRQDIIRRLKDLGIQGKPTAYSPDGIRLMGFHNFRELLDTEGLADLKGSITAQDEAAQLITHMLEPKLGQRVLDACAAPGGKTTHIAELMTDKGEVIAVDSSEKRISMLRENISLMEMSSIKVIQSDVNELKSEKLGLFDRILLDAPCSSIGVIRRNPDVKYRHKPEDLLKFRAKQIEMLQVVSRLLKPSGIILYSTCSTEPEEGEEVIEGFLKTEPDFYIIGSDVSFIKKFLKDNILRTYPFRDDMDGFFGVRICKK